MMSNLTQTTLDMSAVINSLREGLEAIDLYQRRIDTCQNAELKQVLTHNRDEEKEYAAMLIEWIRRQDESFDKELKDYLFTDQSLGHH